MTTRDPFPKDTDQLTESERRLHDAVTAPFERPFDALGYSASFRLVPRIDFGEQDFRNVWATVRERKQVFTQIKGTRGP